jgi:uncharacterized protein (DUF952 family)
VGSNPTVRTTAQTTNGIAVTSAAGHGEAPKAPHSGPIVHLAIEAEWASADASYTPVGFERDGFVHCSAPHQVAHVADRRFAGRTDLVLLTIEPPLLDAPVVWEDLEGEGEDFPHVYGPIPRSAVIAARPYRPGADGSFPRPL